jgi:hypothetical protein
VGELKRTPLRRRTPLRAKPRPDSDKVTPEMHAYIIKRDGGCIAPRVDDDAGPCSGRVTLDHVKTDRRMGKRADSIALCLVSVCEGHSENGMKAGHQWNTANRDLERGWARTKEAERAAIQ